MGSLLCGIQTDGIGRNTLDLKENKQNQEEVPKEKGLSYKDEVKIPGLVMVDDIAAIEVCGTPSLEVNAYINAKIESKKLTLN